MQENKSMPDLNWETDEFLSWILNDEGLYLRAESQIQKCKHVGGVSRMTRAVKRWIGDDYWYWRGTVGSVSRIRPRYAAMVLLSE